MRSTTFALLGITAAMGLGLVLTLSQQSWPLLPSAPIPGFSSERGQAHEGTRVEAVDALATARPAPRPAPGAARAEAGAGDDRKSADRSPSSVEGSRQLVATPPPPAAPPSDDPGTPPSVPAPVAETPGASAPVSSPSPPPAPPASTGSSSSGPSPIAASTNQGKSKPKSKPKPARGKSRSYVPPAPAPAPPAAVVKKEEPSGKEEPAVSVPEDSAPGPTKGKGNAYGHSK